MYVNYLVFFVVPLLVILWRGVFYFFGLVKDDDDVDEVHVHVCMKHHQNNSTLSFALVKGASLRRILNLKSSYPSTIRLISFT